MVKSYLRFEHSKTFGIVTSSSANAIWLPESSSTSTSSRNTGAGIALVPANEDVLSWDLKKSELVSRWHDSSNKAEVTAIASSSADPDVFAVGYADGSIRVWDRKIEAPVVSFNGHKAPVLVLQFDSEGARLVSAGKDTNVIVWDLVGEVGLFRLKGHSDWVTGASFLSEKKTGDAGDGMEVDLLDGMAGSDNYLITTGKDGLMKLWDLTTQHSIETHMAHRGECWSLCLTPDQHGFMTSGLDGELKLWQIDHTRLSTRTSSSEDCLIERGTIYRGNKDRTNTIAFHPNNQFVAAAGPDKSVEIFRIRSEEEIKKVLKRKKKRKIEKAEMKGEQVNGEVEAEAEISDIIVSYVTVRTTGRVRSACWGKKAKGGLNLLVHLTNNALEYYDIEKPSKEKKQEVPDYNKPYSVELPGHRTDVRSLSLSSDDRMLASASSGTLKVWNVRTGACIRTFECGYALCCSFIPGDKIVVVGTKSGELEIFDVASATLIEKVKAHESSIWSLHVHPDGRSMATGSADKNVKFWEFKIVQEEIPGTTRTTPVLRLVHSRTVKLSDDVLSVHFTPNGKYIAASLLDSTVKILFVDSLKLFHNLYGHKLPVLSMDISSDSKLIATCSADKNVKLWGLDFGDCHKSFFAHEDSIMQVVFERNSHNFFSASKDRMIKYYDGDKFDNIQKIDGHHGEIWALVAGKVSDVLISASHDKSIRVWEQTDDQIFLEEEREKEMEQLYEATLTASLEQDDKNDDEGEVGAAGKQTMETLKDGEKVMEALELGAEDLKVIAEHRRAKELNPEIAPPQRNVLYVALGGISAEQHVLRTLQKIKAANLQDALLILPFTHATTLLTFLNIFARNNWAIPLTCKILFSIVKMHHKQLVATKSMRELLEDLRGNLRNALEKQQDMMGYNVAGLRVVERQMRDWAKRDFIDEDDIKKVEERGKRKRAFASLA